MRTTSLELASRWSALCLGALLPLGAATPAEAATHWEVTTKYGRGWADLDTSRGYLNVRIGSLDTAANGEALAVYARAVSGTLKETDNDPVVESFYIVNQNGFNKTAEGSKDFDISEVGYYGHVELNICKYRWSVGWGCSAVASRAFNLQQR